MMVSHSMNDVARLADRLLVMNRSRLAMDGTPQEIFTYENVQRLLEMGLDIPEMTRVFMHLRKLGLNVEPAYTMDQAVAALKTLKGGQGHA